MGEGWKEESEGSWKGVAERGARESPGCKQHPRAKTTAPTIPAQCQTPGPAPREAASACEFTNSCTRKSKLRTIEKESNVSQRYPDQRHFFESKHRSSQETNKVKRNHNGQTSATPTCHRMKTPRAVESGASRQNESDALPNMTTVSFS